MSSHLKGPCNVLVPSLFVGTRSIFCELIYLSCSLSLWMDIRLRGRNFGVSCTKCRQQPLLCPLLRCRGCRVASPRLCIPGVANLPPFTFVSSFSASSLGRLEGGSPGRLLNVGTPWQAGFVHCLSRSGGTMGLSPECRDKQWLRPCSSRPGAAFIHHRGAQERKGLGVVGLQLQRGCAV